MGEHITLEVHEWVDGSLRLFPWLVNHSTLIKNLVHNQLTHEQNMRIMDDDYFHFEKE